MIGKVTSYNSETQTGAIQCENDFYEFHLDDWVSSADPEVDDAVNFVGKKGVGKAVYLVGDYLNKQGAVKSRLLAAFLALILGWCGAHRIYLGYYWVALAQITFTALTMGFGLVWGFIECILLFGGQMNKDAKGRPLK